MKKTLITALIVLLGGAAVLFYLRSGGDAVKFKTSPVTRGSMRATITATGTVNAVTTVLVGTQVSGTVRQLHVDFNSRVRKGQIIAEIDPESFQAQVDQARANLAAARANVQKAKATVQDSARIRDRNRQLFSRNLIAKADLETSEATYDANEAQVAVVLAQVAQTEAALRFAETNLKYTKILSPVDGIVVSRNVDVGQTVAASFQTPTLFTIAQDLTKMQIDTSVDEADIGRIRTGQDCEFNVDAYPDNTFHGTVYQVRIAPITVQNVVTYDVVVKVDNTDLRLKPGMTANVSVVVAGRENVLKLPNAALRFRPPAKPGEKPQAPSAEVKTTPSSGPPAREQTGQAATTPGKEPSRPAGATRTETSRPAGATGGEAGRPAGATGGEAGRPGGATGEAGGRPEAALARKEPSRPGGATGEFGRPGGATGMEGGRRPAGPPGMAGGRPGMTPGGAEGRGPMQRVRAVWILENGEPKRVAVNVGISDGAFTEVVSGDLTEGQEVITETVSKTPKAANNGRPQSSPRFIR